MIGSPQVVHNLPILIDLRRRGVELRVRAAARQASPTDWTPNQIVAFNVAKARLLRGWTQEEAAKAIAPYLGTLLSTASFSAIERSVDVGRVREFNADEIVALARGFQLPIGWFFTPPSVWEKAWRGDARRRRDEGLDPDGDARPRARYPRDPRATGSSTSSAGRTRATAIRHHPDGTSRVPRPGPRGRPPSPRRAPAPPVPDALLRHHFGSVEQADETLASFRAFLADLDETGTARPEADRRNQQNTRRRAPRSD